MSVSPRLLHRLAQLSRRGAARELAAAARDPFAVQSSKLFALLQENRDTEVGRTYGFHRVRSFADYARAVPLQRPAELQTTVARLMRGERNLLTRAPPRYYVRTTGSTGEPKHIPVNDPYQAEFQRTVHVALWHLMRRFPKAFTGRALYFVGSRRVDRAPDGNDVGTMSGFNFSQMPTLVRAVYAWPYQLFEVQDLPTRSFLALWLASVGDVSLIAGIFPAPIVYLLRELDERAGELAACVREGVLPAWLKLPAAQRAFFERRLGSRPDVAKRLERAAQAPVEEKVREAWPQLALVYCWNTATAAMYLPELRQRLGPRVAVRDAIYSACEAWCSIPMGDEEPGGALAVTSHVYEFFDEDDVGLTRTPKGAHELHDGGRYQLVVSTAAGLYRYVLGDLVEVCGFFDRTPRIRFVRKMGAFCNLAGEKLEEAHVTQAVSAQLSHRRLQVPFFALAPELHRPVPGYALHIELPRGASVRDPSAALSHGAAAGPERAAGLAEAVDAELCRVSYDYGRLRTANQLSGVQLRLVPQGSYASFRQSRVGDGSAEAQLKDLRLVDSPEKLPPPLRGN